MKILGLGSYSRTGKDTFANFIVEEVQKLGGTAKKMPFAWKVKQMAFELYSWDGLREPEFYDTKEGEKYRDIPLPTIGKTPVELWVAIGTPAFRDNVYVDTWIDYVLKTDHGVDVLIVPDTRFFNEVMAIKDRGGYVAKVVRPGFGPRPTVADRALIGYTGWDYVIGQSGLLEDLQYNARLFAKGLLGLTDMPPEMSESEVARICHGVEVIKPWAPPQGWVVPDWYPEKYLTTAPQLGVAA